MVIVAEPVVDSVLISDNQVVGEVVPEDPDAPLGVGIRNIVRLTGIIPPQPGTILLGTGEQPVGGKVVSAVQDGDEVEVVLETVPIDEMFDELIITEEIDLSHEVPIIAKAFADNYDARWQPDGTLNFTPRNETPALSEATPIPLAATGVPMGTQVLNPNANHGPFECKADFVTPFVLDGFPTSLSVKNGLGWNLHYDSTQGGLQSLLLFGEITGTFKVANTFTAVLGGKVSCTTKLGEIPIPLSETGVLAALALYVPLSVGFDVEGKITLLQLGFEQKIEAKALIFMGVVCTGGENCSTINTLTPDVKSEFKWITPDVSGTTLQVLSQMRLEPSLSGFLASGLELGFRPELFIPARAKILKTQAGVKLGGNFAIVEGQMADKNYKSNYLLSNDSSIGAGVEFDALGGLFHANLFPPQIKYTDPLAESPKALSGIANVNEFDVGDLITFTVSLDPQHINYPIIGYNVGRVSIYRQTEDDIGGVGPAELLTEVIPANGATEIQLTWTADDDGLIGGDYFAFVETKALPFPYFAELEVATIIGRDDCVYLLEIDSGTYRYIRGCRDPDDYSKYTTIYHIINTTNGVDLVQYVDEGVSDTMWKNLDVWNACECTVTSGWSLVHDYDQVTWQDSHDFSYNGCGHPSGYNQTLCWPEMEGDVCGPYVCPFPGSIQTHNAFPGTCLTWWGHYDDQDVWQECTY
jgi:hypothetical protein